MTSNSLAAMSNEPQTITVDGRTYTCGPWQMGDYAKVERVIRGNRLNELIEGCRLVPLMADPEIMGGAVAKLQQWTPTSLEMHLNPTARTELVLVNLQRNDKTVSDNDVRSIGPMTLRRLFDLMSDLAGLTEKDDDADPTTSSTQTEGEK